MIDSLQHTDKLEAPTDIIDGQKLEHVACGHYMPPPANKSCHRSHICALKNSARNGHCVARSICHSVFTFTRMEEEKGKLHCFCLKHPNPVCAQRHTQQ